VRAHAHKNHNNFTTDLRKPTKKKRARRMSHPAYEDILMRSQNVAASNSSATTTLHSDHQSPPPPQNVKQAPSTPPPPAPVTRGFSHYVQEREQALRRFDKDARVFTCASSHVSEQFADNPYDLNAVVLDIDGRVPAREILREREFIGGISMFELQEPSTAETDEEIRWKLGRFHGNPVELFRATGILDTSTISLLCPALFRSAKPEARLLDRLRSEPALVYQEMVKRPAAVDQSNGGGLLLHPVNTFFGVYRFIKGARTCLAIVVKNYNAPPHAVDYVFKEGTRSVHELFVSSLYRDAKLEGYYQRALMAYMLADYLGLTLKGTTPKEVRFNNIALVHAAPDADRPEQFEQTLERINAGATHHDFNVLVQDDHASASGSASVVPRYLYYQKCYDTSAFGVNVLLGLGPTKGFWLISYMKSDTQSVRWSSRATRNIFPMGGPRDSVSRRHIAKLHKSECFQSDPKERVVNWGSFLRNYKAQQEIYQPVDHTTEKGFYNQLKTLGYDMGNKLITDLEPVSFYMSTPSVTLPQLPIEEFSRWPVELKEPWEQKLFHLTGHNATAAIARAELFFIPSTHMFVQKGFLMHLFATAGKRLQQGTNKDEDDDEPMLRQQRADAIKARLHRPWHHFQLGQHVEEGGFLIHVEMFNALNEQLQLQLEEEKRQQQQKQRQ
jgi:hypothetical protein